MSIKHLELLINNHIDLKNILENFDHNNASNWLVKNLNYNNTTKFTLNTKNIFKRSILYKNILYQFESGFKEQIIIYHQIHDHLDTIVNYLINTQKKEYTNIDALSNNPMIPSCKTNCLYMKRDISCININLKKDYLITLN
jgi:hypothetical protein